MLIDRPARGICVAQELISERIERRRHSKTAPLACAAGLLTAEATGQRPLPAREFPFPSLREQGIIRDDGMSDIQGPFRGIAIDDRFHPVSDQISEDGLFCLSLPFLLGRHPFIQGITRSHEMGLVVGQELAGAIERDFHRAQASQTGVAGPLDGRPAASMSGASKGCGGVVSPSTQVRGK
jgi:hypothetical protein